MKPRGLFFIHQFRPVANGAELQAERLAIKLLKLGHPMQVLTQLRTPESLSEETIEGVPVHRVSFPLAYWIKHGVVDTFRYLVKRRHSYDVIHVHQAFGHAVVVVVVARCFGKKCIIKIACAGTYGDLNVFSGFEGFKWASQILRQADRVVAISREVEDELLRWGFPAERIVCIPNGVDTGYFQRRYPLPERDPVRFILVARRTPQKGIDVALHAAERLLEQEIGHRFEIRFYGIDYPEHDYQAMAQQLGVMEHVRFLPYTEPEAMLDVYQTCNCLLLPSRGEGLSNVLLEAMAMELPIIATRVSGTVDVVDDGENGILIPPDSSQALADAMSAIILNPDLARSLGRKARQKVIESFSLESVTHQYSALYQQLYKS
ncbi:MAG: glycosyltransferase family 4 protein [Pseudomonadota bacterium]